MLLCTTSEVQLTINPYWPDSWRIRQCRLISHIRGHECIRSFAIDCFDDCELSAGQESRTHAGGKYSEHGADERLSPRVTIRAKSLELVYGQG